MEAENLRKWLQTRVEDASGKVIKLIELFEILRIPRAELIKSFLRLDKSMMAKKKDDLNWMTEQFTTSEKFNSDDEIENLKILFSKINELDDNTLEELRSKYLIYDFKMFTPNYVGGRKLTRHRKSNAKSKSKRKHKRRSFKKSSHRRQRH